MKTPTSHGTAAAARARIRLSRQSTLHLYHLPSKIVEGFVQHTVNRILRVKGNEAEAPGALCCLVIHHHNIGDSPEGLEVLPELLICQTGGQSAHKNLLCPSTTGIAAAAAAAATTSSVPSCARVHRLGSLLLLPRERPLHIDRAAVEGVGLLEGGVDGGGVGVDYEAEAPRAASELVAHDGGLGDLAEVGEVLLQLLLRRLPGDAADEELALIRLHHRLLAPLLSSDSLALGCGRGAMGRGRERGELGDFGFGIF